MIRDAIDEQSCAVREAGNGTEALEMIDQRMPDIMLLDQEMPGLRGNEVLEFLQHNEPTRDIMVIVVTSHSDNEKIGESLRLGAVEFISKPFNHIVLKARIANVVKTSLLVREHKILSTAAEAASRSKSEFLANVSHEIRTPMTAILGFSSLLLESVREPDHIAAVTTIQRNGEHLLSLINDVLDLSKIEAGKMDVELTRISPVRLALEVDRLMRVRAEAKSISLAVSCEGPIPEMILADVTRLRQILINIVGNAIKFMDSGTIAINVSCQPEEQTLRFDVVDTGIGLTEEQIGNLFQPFGQADSSVTRKFGGTGLGLTISRRLARLMGGDISVSSEFGQGSTFSIMIATGSLEGVRLLDNVRQQVEEVENKRTNETTTVSDVKLNCRILLAEDGPDNQRLLSLVLRKAGAEIVIASNGQIACDLFTEAGLTDDPIDVILMDMQMPVLDGYSATKRLRDEGYQVPIIALTAHAMVTDREKCLNSGCDDFLTKPIDRQKLLQCVQKWSASKRAMIASRSGC